MKQYLVSTGVMPMCVGKKFDQYEGIFEAYKKLDIDGVELVFLPEWETNHPPLTPTAASWSTSPKIEVNELVKLCIKNDLPVPIVHINRDVGNMLCSTEKETRLEGQKVLDNNLRGASILESQIAVLHMWDTYDQNLDIEKLFSNVYEVAKHYQIQLTIENIPMSDKKLSPEKAWELLNVLLPPDYGFTLDLNWCSLYNNFAALMSYQNKILNVHVQGYLSLDENNNYTLIPRVGNLDIIRSLAEICQLGYDRYITLELNKPKGEFDFVQALKIIRNNS